MSKEKLNFLNIRSAQNQHFKQLKALRSSKKAREESQLVALFDAKAIVELSEYIPAQKLFATNEEDLAKIKAKEKFILESALFEKASGLSVLKGMAAIYFLPQPVDPWPSRLLILDGVSDPGNLGTLIRSAIAFGFIGAILLDTCSDPFNDKALRASCGLTLRFWLKKMSVEKLLKLLASSDYAIFVADAKGSEILEFPNQKKLALILGAEGSGVSKELINMGKTIAIKMDNQVESLNVAVAGSIFMYEMSHER